MKKSIYGFIPSFIDIAQDEKFCNLINIPMFRALKFLKKCLTPQKTDGSEILENRMILYKTFKSRMVIGFTKSGPIGAGQLSNFHPCP